MVVVLLSDFERVSSVVAYGRSEEEVFQKLKTLECWNIRRFLEGDSGPQTLQELVELGNDWCRAFDDIAYDIIKLPDAEIKGDNAN